MSKTSSPEIDTPDELIAKSTLYLERLLKARWAFQEARMFRGNHPESIFDGTDLIAACENIDGMMAALMNNVTASLKFEQRVEAIVDEMNAKINELLSHDGRTNSQDPQKAAEAVLESGWVSDLRHYVRRLIVVKR